MSKMTEAEIQSTGANLACDMFELSGFKSRVVGNLELFEDILGRMPSRATSEEMLAIIQVAKDTLPQMGKLD